MSKGLRTMTEWLLLIGTFPILALYAWLLLQSFGSGGMSNPFATGLSLSNWRFLWEGLVLYGHAFPSIWRITANTLVLALGLTILSVPIATMTAYALARFEFRGRGPILAGVILLHAFPAASLLIALFYVLNVSGLIDSLLGVILVKVALDLPMQTWIMKGFFDNVSWDMERSALIDGCTRLGALKRIILPVVRPGLGAVSIFAFLSGWSEFLYAHTFLFGSQTYTLSVFLRALTSDAEGLHYGQLSALTVFYMLPVFLFFMMAQRAFVQGTASGTKG